MRIILLILILGLISKLITLNFRDTSKRCPGCNGTGTQRLTRYNGEIEVSSNEEECETCGGAGII